MATATPKTPTIGTGTLADKIKAAVAANSLNNKLTTGPVGAATPQGESLDNRAVWSDQNSNTMPIQAVQANPNALEGQSPTEQKIAPIATQADNQPSGVPATKPAKAAAKAKDPFNAPTAQVNEVQQDLNKGIAPYLSQLQSVVDLNKSLASQQNISNLPPSVQSAITNMQKLTGKALNGLVPDTKKAAGEYVQDSATSQLLSMLPDALIYHAIDSNLTGFPNQSGQSQGLQDLWKTIENINAGSSDPTQASSASIQQLFQNSVPTNYTTDQTASQGSATTGG